MKRILSVFLVVGVIALLTGCNLNGDSGGIVSDVYAGGYCDNSSDVAVPGYWKNGTWNGLPPLDVMQDAAVLTLVVCK